jgi:hypothetical protein
MFFDKELLIKYTKIVADNNAKLVELHLLGQSVYNNLPYPCTFGTT